ncbi:MAG: N-acetylmuramoyl-L-alanine amidase [Pseudomonadota bacterium]
MFDIKNHRLFQNGKQVDYKPTPNKGSTITPEWLVMHYTAGGSYNGAINWLVNPAAQASAHLVIGFDGEITQLAPFNVKTWHAGKSFWKGIHFLNKNTIGIELVNKGFNVGAGDDFIEARHKNGGPIRKWQTYPQVQIDISAQIAVALKDKYDLSEVLGHDDISPGRKSDPGPAFDMDQFRGRMFGRNEDDNGGLSEVGVSDDLAIVDTGNPDDSLNMRRWPSLESAIIEPIPHGAKVMVIRRNPGQHDKWSEVFYNNQIGWVVTHYLK